MLHRLSKTSVLLLFNNVTRLEFILLAACKRRLQPLYILGCDEQSLVGRNNFNIPNSSYTTSSYFISPNIKNDVRYQPHNAKLNGSRGWAARNNDDSDDYLQIDLGRPRVITAIATQGSGFYDEWVTTYKINYTNDLSKWTSYVGSNGEIKVKSKTDL